MRAPRGGGRRGTLAAALVVLAAATAAATGNDRAVEWSFEVLDVTPEPDGHLLRLKPMPPGRKFPRSCETFVVHASYRIDPESRHVSVPISRQQHDDALRYLERAEASGRIIRFGSIGRGFAAVAERPRCEVVSEGLVHISTTDGRSAVFSVVARR